MFGFIIAALLAEFALYLAHYPFLWLLPPCFFLLERSPIALLWRFRELFEDPLRAYFLDS